MLSKILNVVDAAEPRQLDETVVGLPRPWVFTNGVFDILHRGHVEYLDDAAALGASLIVGLNSDTSARMLDKGVDRPFNKDCDRAVLLSGLASVSVTIMFDEPTPSALLSRIRPDIYVKGGDYDVETLEETMLVRSWGGDARSILYRTGFSTTDLVARIRAGS